MRIQSAARRLRSALRPDAPAPEVTGDDRPATDPPQPHLASVLDEHEQRTISDVRFYTMVSTERLVAVMDAVKYVVDRGVPGALVECGVWRGGSVLAMIRTLQQLGVDDRDVYLFDTFEGMTEPTEHDVRFDGQSASSQLATQDRHESKVWAYASLEDVQAGFETVPYPSERVHFIKGPVEETVPGELPEQIAILRLDTDWYESTAHELTHMYDRLVPGGVLMLDDYGWWQGSKLATEEFLDRTGEQLLLIRMGSGRVAVKR
jgi:O-methyltransferase